MTQLWSSRLQRNKSFLPLCAAGFWLTSSGYATDSQITIPSQGCNGKELSSPLRHVPKVFSPFKPDKKHYGADFVASDEDVLSVAAGKIETIAFQQKPLTVGDPRSGLKIKGWGYYVVVSHNDGSNALFAHLKKDSAAHLKVGDAVKAGDKIGVSDTSGGATGPHLHFEYSPSGKIYGGTNKADPNLCILRSGWLTLESFPASAQGEFQLYIGDTLVGENPPGGKIRVNILLKAGKYPIRAVAKNIPNHRKAYFAVEMDEPLTILNLKGGDEGPGLSEELEQGQSVDATLLVR